jgi:hypothetical protein
MSGYGYVSYRISTSVDIPKAPDMCSTALSGDMHTDMDLKSATEQTDKENLEWRTQGLNQTRIFPTPRVTGPKSPCPPALAYGYTDCSLLTYNNPIGPGSPLSRA